MIQAKATAAALSSVSALIAVESVPDLGPYPELGLAGAALGIIWWLVAKGNPAADKRHSGDLRHVAELNAAAVEAASQRIEASVERLASEMRDQNARAFDVLANAINCPAVHLHKHQQEPVQIETDSSRGGQQ